MSNPFELNPANKELEKVLGSLKPASIRLDRDRLMFEAGRASASQQTLRWPIISATLAIMLFFSFTTHFGRQEDPNNRVITAQNSQPSNPLMFNHWASLYDSDPELKEPAKVMENSYWQLRDQVALNGLEGLPTTTPGLQSHSISFLKLSNKMKPSVIEQN